MTTTTTTVQRELYSELGTLAAAYRIEARRHLFYPIRDALEDMAREVSSIRVRYWSGIIDDGAAFHAFTMARSMLDDVAEWDA
jgi:hypothetical protein